MGWAEAASRRNAISTAAHTRPRFCGLAYRFPEDTLAWTGSILTHHS